LGCRAGRVFVGPTAGRFYLGPSELPALVEEAEEPLDETEAGSTAFSDSEALDVDGDGGDGDGEDEEDGEGLSTGGGTSRASRRFDDDDSD
jgi:hypothetical protein